MKIAGCLLPVVGTRQRKFSPVTVIGGATDVSSDRKGKEFSDSSEPTAVNDNSERNETDSVDEGKMVRVCDKLIGVFMVDKPTPNDWRRLLAFSKEWDNIRPHFFKRCQERADSEHDPGMKHKLFRLARKLKEVRIFKDWSFL